MNLDFAFRSKPNFNCHGSCIRLFILIVIIILFYFFKNFIRILIFRPLNNLFTINFFYGHLS